MTCAWFRQAKPDPRAARTILVGKPKNSQRISRHGQSIEIPGGRCQKPRDAIWSKPIPHTCVPLHRQRRGQTSMERQMRLFVPQRPPPKKNLSEPKIPSVRLPWLQKALVQPSVPASPLTEHESRWIRRSIAYSGQCAEFLSACPGRSVCWYYTIIDVKKQEKTSYPVIAAGYEVIHGKYSCLLDAAGQDAGNKRFLCTYKYHIDRQTDQDCCRHKEIPADLRFVPEQG